MTSRDKLHILRFLGIDAEPAVMANAKLRRPFRFDFGEMAKIIAKPMHRAAIKPGPKSGFANRDTATLRHAMVVVGDTGDHVDVGVDVEGHGCNSLCQFALRQQPSRVLSRVA